MRRAGFSAIELMLVMAIGGLVAAAIGGVLRRQQRFFTNAAAIVEQRVSLRDATGILPSELRALSPAGGDVLAYSDSSLEIRATIGSAIACDTVAGGEAIDLASASNAGSRRLGAYATAPQPGDIALVYDADASAGSTTSAWVTLPIVDVGSRTDVCAGSPLIDPTERPVADRLRVRFAPGTRIPASVRAGAFVRVLRRVRYRFYRSGTAQWFLGYAEWGGAAFGAVQPVSGPYAPYSRAGGGGLSLRYFDRAGATIASLGDAGRIARIEIVVRGTLGSGMLGGPPVYTDSQTIAVRVRNP
jgi:prepilin-type N-terminal cleavage/methylation domain-containing protein